MHRTACALVAALASGACAGRSPAPAAPPARAARACLDDPEVPSVVASSAEPPWGARVTAVELRGATRVPSSLVRGAIQTQVGEPLTEAKIAGDLTRLDALEVFDGIRVEAEPATGGTRVRFVVEERRRVASVIFEGSTPKPALTWLALAPGEIFDRARLSRSARGLRAHLFDAGHRRAEVEARSHLLPSGEVAVCYRVTPGPRYRIGRLAFSGNHSIPSQELALLIDTHDGAVNQAGAPLREDLMQTDLLRISALYYDRGFASVHVDAPRVTLDSQRARADVEIQLQEGPEYRLGKLAFAGDASLSRATQLGLMGVAPGEVFDRSKMLAGIARLEAEYRRRGRPTRVTPESALHEETARIDLTFRLERER